MLQLIMPLLVVHVSAQFYPGYPYYYYGLQHLFAPINSQIFPPVNIPFAVPVVAEGTIKPEDTEGM